MKATLLCLIVLFLAKVLAFDLLRNNEETDKCFCQLEGKIDDCLCNVDTVDYFNNMKIYPRLNSILQVSHDQCSYTCL